MTFKTKAATLVACMLAMGVALTPQRAGTAVGISVATATNTVTPTATPTATASACDNIQQTTLRRPIPLGISGGNNHSLLKFKTGGLKGCFGGTLGSMVQDSSDNEYILSNNHVLADQNKAKPGESIVQPGLEDTACVKAQSNTVATFSRAIKLRFGGHKNFVDAALASVASGQVTPEILFIGEIASSADDAPTLGMPVQKMGRTTCLTIGKISQLDANFQVNYSDTMKPHLANFVNQIAVTGILGGAFGGPGDSGSLIVTTDDCPRAVALLFAGTSDGSITFANPISEVLTRLDVSMVGTCTAAVVSDAAGEDASAASVGMSADVVASAKSVRDRNEDRLMSVPGAVGSAIAASDQPGQPAIVIYVKKLTPQVQASAPNDIEGTPVKLIETGEINAY